MNSNQYIYFINIYLYIDSASTCGVVTGIKRKTDNSAYNEANKNAPLSLTSTIEDLEEDLIPSHTLKKMKYGNTVSVEVKTRQDIVSEK